MIKSLIANIAIKSVSLASLLDGVSLARRYSCKAKSIIIDDRLRSITAEVDIKALYTILKEHEDEDGLIRNMERDIGGAWVEYGEAELPAKWIVSRACSHVESALARYNPTLKTEESASVFVETLSAVIKDGIIFGLFFPTNILVQMIEQDYGVDTTSLDEDVDSTIKEYEYIFGAIK